LYITIADEALLLIMTHIAQAWPFIPEIIYTPVKNVVFTLQ